MTPEQLAEIEARLEAATPGPWAISGRVVYEWPGARHIQEPRSIVCEGDSAKDLEFIAHAPDDIRDLIAEVRRLQGELRAVDNLLARRPAIDHFTDRLDKINHALVTAGKHEPGNRPVRPA